MAYQVPDTVTRLWWSAIPSPTCPSGVCPQGVWEWGPRAGAHMNGCSPGRALPEPLQAPAGCSMKRVREPQKETAARANRSPSTRAFPRSNRLTWQDPETSWNWGRFVSLKRRTYMQWLSALCMRICGYMCADIHTCAFAWTQTCVFLCGHTHLCIFMYIDMCEHIQVYLWICIYLHTHTYTHVYLCEHTRLYVWLCACVSLCVGIYTCIFMCAAYCQATPRSFIHFRFLVKSY